MTGARVAPWCRVLVIEPGDEIGGSQQCLVRLAPLMEERGVEQILAAAPGGDTARLWREGGRRCVDLPESAARSVRNSNGRLSFVRAAREMTRTASAGRRIARLARHVRADAVIANSHWSHLEVMFATRFTRRASVLFLHELSRPDPIGRLRGLAVLGADATVGVSAAVARSLSPRASRAVRVIPNGIDADVFAPGRAVPAVRAQLTEDSSAPVVLVVARLAPNKGIADVIGAVAGLPPQLSHTRLAIAGASSDPAFELSLRALATSLLGTRARFLGARRDVDELLRAADVLVLASEAEGLGLCVLEAQACGRPVVAYPAGGVAELIEHRVTGLLAGQGDVADLSRQISQVLDDPVLAARLGEAARRRVLTEGTLQRQADAQTAVLREIILDRGRR